MTSAWQGTVQPFRGAEARQGANNSARIPPHVLARAATAKNTASLAPRPVAPHRNRPKWARAVLLRAPPARSPRPPCCPVHPPHAPRPATSEPTPVRSRPPDTAGSPPAPLRHSMRHKPPPARNDETAPPARGPVSQGFPPMRAATAARPGHRMKLLEEPRQSSNRPRQSLILVSAERPIARQNTWPLPSSSAPACKGGKAAHSVRSSAACNRVCA